MIQRFLDFSSEVTAFTVFDLLGTGQADAYLAAVVGVIGAPALDELLDAYDRLRNEPHETREWRIRREILGDEKLGPIARNIIKIWYLGIWFELPRTWTETFGPLEKNVLFMVSASAYTESLIWRAVGANPPGAKAPGYGSWSEVPQIPPVPVLP